MSGGAEASRRPESAQPRAAGGSGDPQPPPPIPCATYRLQFNADFTFDDATELLDYLHALGISHCYASPYLKARPQSPHGYDIVDHQALNPEIGAPQDFARFVRALRARGMGQILDLVPNHMGIGSDNAWWVDVLENGEASPYAEYFDIDWYPLKEELRHKVLLPVLGDHYGAVLEAGELQVEFDPVDGSFSLRYFEHCLPLDPATYSMLLVHGLPAVPAPAEGGDGGGDFLELQSIATSFAHLPARTQRAEVRRAERLRDKEIFKRRLAELCARSPPVCAHLRAAVEAYNGRRGDAASFDALHALLERQAYRLAYWQVAADEVNYRRFFDINDLAGLRQERGEVFEATHRYVLELIAQGCIDGLRIDHADGLFDPAEYCERLRASLREKVAVPARSPPTYLVLEKILSGDEQLPAAWPVHGTTGYDFMNAVNGLLVCPDGERVLESCHARFAGRRTAFADVVYACRRLVVRTQLSSELTVLAHLADDIATADRRTRDYTLNGLREALTEVVACFPVYRTYVRAAGVSASDRRYVDAAIAQAKARGRAADVSIFDFLRRLLLLEFGDGESTAYRERVLRFVMKLQQYTAPVMAKAVEDTALYRYNRLLALNEVGGDPARFGVSVASFHRSNEERGRRWPHALLATSTHDSKRGEDVRARLAVLSEIPEEWRRRVGRWGRLNRAKKQLVDGRAAPARDDEYHLYQTLLGVWPADDPDPRERAELRARLEGYMIKALREAKLRSSWINPDSVYEGAMGAFVGRLLDASRRNAFLDDFRSFQRRVARYGLWNGLAQSLLKLTAPGVPDIYQGEELPAWNLVDPDNRRAVDYALRRRLLAEIRELATAEPELAAQARAFARRPEDGRAKLYLIWRVLGFRRAHPELFREGDYVPLAAVGSRAEHLCAFARCRGSEIALVVVPRWFARLEPTAAQPPLGPLWEDTVLALDTRLTPGAYRNELTGETLASREYGDGRALRVADALASFPVALLAPSRPRSL